jgi:small subunit ribosomal protein S4
LKLYLKGERCFTEKCAVDRRNYPPGQHGGQKGHFRKKISDYALRLREKQKVKGIFGIYERQFEDYVTDADRMKGITGYNLLLAIERRLDNMVYRMGFGTSRSQARQLVRHRHILVNGKKVNIPSFQVKIGDVIELEAKKKNNEFFKHALGTIDARGGIPRWLEVNRDLFRGVVADYPKREELTLPVQEQLIVEFYSR